MGDPKHQNHVRQLREAQLMSKAELARKAGLSPLTIDRVESGKPCRMDTKRKIILALGYKLTDRHKVFPDDPKSGEAAASPGRRSKKEREAAATETAPEGSAGPASEEAPRTLDTPPPEGGSEPREGRGETSGDGAPTESPDRAKARYS